MRSATVGTPKILVPPGFGISTAFTAGGKYVPDDIRFQILYRFFFRSFSNASIEHWSTPAAPLFALTRLYASHTRLFGTSNGLSCGPDMFTRFIPGQRPVVRVNKSR